MKTPFHKRIGKHVINYHKHFTKYLYERDTLIATSWIFIFIIALGLIPINFYVMNPVKLALKDLDLNDVSYSSLNEGSDTLDRNFVIINIGQADREGIADIINKTATYNPKVMALDVLFDGPRDSVKDEHLKHALDSNKNLVVVNRLEFEHGKEAVENGFFEEVDVKRGYANLIGDSPEERNSIRNYSPHELVNGKEYEAFSSVILKMYDLPAYRRMVKRHKQVEIINYSRRIQQYPVIDAENLMMDQVDSSYIRGRIALIAYVNNNENDIEDKFFTPMNKRFAGKSTPDMNGIIVHANIISMALEDNYIKKLPSWVNWLVAILIGWLHMSFFIRYYLESHIWFHLVAKIAQLASALFFSYVGIHLYDRYNVKLDMKLSLIVIVMAVDVIYFYEAFAVWMHKKFHYHTVFHQQHH
jgi:CHASE2 domain-containing sensor protein